MHIILFAFISVLVYFATLIVLYLFKNRLNKDVINATFILFIFGAFVALNLSYFKKGNLDEFMTLDNISPLTFTLLPLMYFMRGKVKDSFLSMVALLSVGMFVAMMINLGYSYLHNFRQLVSLDQVYDTISHGLCSLFGIYLIISGQIKINFKSLRQAMIFLYSIITFGVILNIVFHKSYFGMDPYGNASIYMLDLFSNFYTTLIAYYFGIAVVLIIGLQFGYLMERLSIEKKEVE